MDCSGFDEVLLCDNSSRYNNKIFEKETKVMIFVEIYVNERYITWFRGCLGLLHKLCSTNSIVEQLHKKLEFVEYLFRCSHNSTLFSRAECVELKLFG